LDVRYRPLTLRGTVCQRFRIMILSVKVHLQHWRRDANNTEGGTQFPCVFTIAVFGRRHEVGLRPQVQAQWSRRNACPSLLIADALATLKHSHLGLHNGGAPMPPNAVCSVSLSWRSSSKINFPSRADSKYRQHGHVETGPKSGLAHRRIITGKQTSRSC